MNQAESSTIVRGRGRNKRKWTWDKDEELVKALCEVSLDPRFRVQGGGFKNCYSQGIESLLAQRLHGRGIKASPHVVSRLKVLKRKFYSIKDMLASPGFSWDGSRKVVRCEKERYDEYCKDNPRAKGLNGIPFPHFDAFDAVYGKDRTAREGMEVSEEATANLENGNTSEGGDEEAGEDRMSTGPSGRPLDAASSNKKQKKCMSGWKTNRIEPDCLSMDNLRDVCGQYQLSRRQSACRQDGGSNGAVQGCTPSLSECCSTCQLNGSSNGGVQGCIHSISECCAECEHHHNSHGTVQGCT